MESEISMSSPDIRIPILTCDQCDGYWRAEQPERCRYCARDYGILSQQITPERRLALFQAIQTLPMDAIHARAPPAEVMPRFYQLADQFLAALEEHCQWYDPADPLCAQACWFAIQQDCPWASLNPRAQALWDDFHGPQPISVDSTKIIFASLFFELDFQDSVHTAELLGDHSQEIHN